MSRGLVLLGALTLLAWLAPFSLANQELFSPEEFSEKEKEALRKAAKPQKQLKVYLDIVSHRLKQLQALAQKCDEGPAQRYLKGYQLALNRADDLASKEDPSDKKARRLLQALLKATQKINASLIQTLEKSPQECRPIVQSALEVSQQVNSAVEVQLLKAGNP